MNNKLDTTQLYQGYSYSYPHKSSYRTFEEIGLQEVWKDEDMQNLFFYAHIPFCEMRCGFCNLFTVSNPKEGVKEYIQTIKRELDSYKEKFPHLSFSQFAIGGGTPTFLEEDELHFLLSEIRNFGVLFQKMYGSIEASPKTLTEGKIQIIEQSKITRLSLGIQSWLEEETKALGRPQKIAETEQTVKVLATSHIPEFNLDLIYGAENQSEESFQYSVEKTIDFQPTEIFLYPLYVRQLTGLGKKQKEASAHREILYLKGREILLQNGYEQVSMRCFRKMNTPYPFADNEYDAKVNGMIGVGAGARSYTKTRHYSTDYAVESKEIKNIIANYIQKNDFDTISYGFQLNEDEQKRRFLVKAFTEGGELSIEKYNTLFNANPFDEYDLLKEFEARNWLSKRDHTIKLSAEGMKHEDVIGPALYSEEVKNLMHHFSWK